MLKFILIPNKQVRGNNDKLMGLIKKKCSKIKKKKKINHQSYFRKHNIIFVYFLELVHFIFLHFS